MKTIVKSPPAMGRVHQIDGGKAEPCSVMTKWGSAPLLAITGRIELHDEVASLARLLSGRGEPVVAITLEMVQTSLEESVLVSHLVGALDRVDPLATVVVVTPHGAWTVAHLSKWGATQISETEREDLKARDAQGAQHWYTGPSKEWTYAPLRTSKVQKVRRMAHTVTGATMDTVGPPLRWVGQKCRNVAVTLREKVRPKDGPKMVVEPG